GIAGRFTVCSLWPLGYLPACSNRRTLPYPLRGVRDSPFPTRCAPGKASSCTHGCPSPWARSTWWRPRARRFGPRTSTPSSPGPPLPAHTPPPPRPRARAPPRREPLPLAHQFLPHPIEQRVDGEVRGSVQDQLPVIPVALGADHVPLPHVIHRDLGDELIRQRCAREPRVARPLVFLSQRHLLRFPQPAE